MIDLEIDVKIHESEDENAWLDTYERDMMIQHTVEHLRIHIQRSLADLRCQEHNEPPRVHITVIYSQELEQFEDLKYDVQTCCKPFLMKTVAALNKR
ncbi:MAG: hypothetical protein CUN56_12245 [Phototrophicales bacterium]|nr:MAG: hypothetical protein CUN56_12245 [Phototrophicales bacterium]RMG77709.1 MAG: hypothetical protein D6711_00870 [Chloroflexota bacterium]